MASILWLAFLLAGQLPQEARVGYGTIERHLITAGLGTRFLNISLIQVRVGAIHGRVIQPDGQPASGISVELLKATVYAKSPRLLKPSGQLVKIGANGDFRFDVGPGEYYIRTVTTPGGSQARTYFPDTSDPGEAKALLVGQGDDISADIHVSTTPVFKISGRIVDLLPDRQNHYPAGVSLSSNSSTAREYKLQSAFPGMPVCCAVNTVPDLNVSVSVSNDRFEIRGVRPGTYQVTAAIVVAESKPEEGIVIYKVGEKLPYSVRYRGQTSIEITNTDVENIRVEVVHGADLNGRIVSNGKRVNTKDTDFFMRGPDYDPNSLLLTSVDKNGRFSFPNLLDGTYTLDLVGLPINAYVEKILHGGRKLSGLDVTVSRANPEPLEIIMNASPGQIDGQVLSSYRPVLVVVPTDDRTIYVPLPVRRVDEHGDFSVRGLAPGQYRIFAFNTDASDVFSASSIAEFVRPYEAQGTTLVVKSGARTKVRLVAIDIIRK